MDVHIFEIIVDGDLESLKKIVLQCGSEVVNGKNKHVYTPLSLASDCGYLEIVKFLVLECKVNIGNDYGHIFSPLRMAFRAGHLEVVKFLISEGVDYEELLEEIEDEDEYEDREKLEMIILEIADTRVKFIT